MTDLRRPGGKFCPGGGAVPLRQRKSQKMQKWAVIQPEFCLYCLYWFYQH